MKRVLVGTGIGVALIWGANIEGKKSTIVQHDQQLIQILTKHMECVKKATSAATIKQCNFEMRKAKKIIRLKEKIEKEKAKTGATSLPKLENQLKCVEKATNSKELKECKNK
jgi:hypothetical protein